MSERGNDIATADVRPHAWTGAALLAVGALAVVLRPGLAEAALFAGWTLVLATAVLWYLPSFTKRALLGPDAFAALGAALLVAGVLVMGVAPAIPLGAWLLAAGLVHLALVVLASALLGAPWRSGIPFWRTGAHRAGDAAAAAAMTLGFLLLATSVVFHPLVVGPVGLLAVALGALAHLLPRSRGVEPIAALVVAGTAIACAAAFARALTPAIPSWLAPLGILLAAVGIYARPSAKRAGPRLREAAPPILAALVLVALAATGFARAVPVAAGAAVFAVAILALPVVFNQRPARAFILPASALMVLAPVVPLVGAFLHAGALLLALATLAPLRTPRRYCPPDLPEAS